MPQRKLFLLGPPLLEQDGVPIDVGRRKAIALLSHLATTGTVHHRDSLAALFWPDDDPSSARANLRRMLSVLNKSLGQGVLISERSTVGVAMETLRQAQGAFRRLPHNLSWCVSRWDGH